MATILPFGGFDPEVDCKALRKAMKGMGTDEAALIQILCARSASQREVLKGHFKQMFGKDLIENLKSELTGNFENLMVALMTPLDELLAMEVKRAIKGLGTDEDLLIEIFCTRSNAEIEAIKAAYQRLYGKSLEKQVESELSGDLKRVMVSVMSANRPENVIVNPEKARAQAQELVNAGAACWGTDEVAFVSILCCNSFEQVRAVCYEYKALTGRDIMQDIESEMSGDTKRAMLAIVKSIFNTPLYYAECLRKAMKGVGCDKQALIRIIVSRCEIDLAFIREEYLKVFGVTLEKAIKSETSGDLETALLVIVRQN